jgi:drug/metabolite transporter (DMT)-like permease
MSAVSALLAACIFWGIGFPISKALTMGVEASGHGISSWFMAAYLIGARFLVAAIVIAAASRTRPTRRELAQGAALGIVTGVGMLFQLDGLQYTEVSTNAFLTQGYIVLLPMATTFVTRKTPSARVLSCSLLVLVGLAVLARFDLKTLSLGRGETETLAASACFTVQILLLDSARYAENRASPVSIVMFAVMALVMLPALAITARGAADFAAPFAMPMSGWYFALLTILPTVGSFSLMNRYQRLVSATEAGIIYATEPVFASAFALVVPGWVSRLSGISYRNEALEPRLLVGGSLVVVANVLLALGQKSRRPSVEESARALDAEA